MEWSAGVQLYKEAFERLRRVGGARRVNIGIYLVGHKIAGIRAKLTLLLGKRSQYNSLRMNLSHLYEKKVNYSSLIQYTLM